MTKKPEAQIHIDMSKQKRSRARRDNRSFSQRFWHDKDGNIVIFQRPNNLLIAWFVTWLISQLFFVSPLREISSWGAFILLLVWSALEAYSGVNLFRKYLGVLVFLLAILVRSAI